MSPALVHASWINSNNGEGPTAHSQLSWELQGAQPYGKQQVSWDGLPPAS